MERKNEAKVLFVLAFFLASFWPAFALASDTIAAEALFNRGRELMDSGNYDEACPKFAESHKLDPATGTLLNLAKCYEKAGKKASAWAAYKSAAASARDAGQEGREEHAREQADRVEKELAYINLVVSSRAKVDGFVLNLDGAVQNAALFGTEFPIDAGTHVVRASAPEHEEWSQSVSVKDGQKYEIVVPALKPLSKEVTLLAEPTTAAEEPNAAPDEEPARSANREEPKTKEAREPASSDQMEEARTGTGQRVAGWLLASAGAATGVVGGVFGVRAIIKYVESNDDCDEENRCGPAGTTARNSARSSGDVSTGLMIAGAVVATVGIVVVVTAPRASQGGRAVVRDANVGFAPEAGGGSLFWRGTF